TDARRQSRDCNFVDTGRGANGAIRNGAPRNLGHSAHERPGRSNARRPANGRGPAEAAQRPTVCTPRGAASMAALPTTLGGVTAPGASRIVTAAIVGEMGAVVAFRPTTPEVLES